MWAGLAVVGFLVFAAVMVRWGRKDHQGSSSTPTGSGASGSTDGEGFKPPVKT